MRIVTGHQRGGLAPLHVRPGRHVYQRLNPQHQGTVVQADAMGFTIAYDSHGRSSREPRTRQWFPLSRAWDFLPGKPSYEHAVVASSDES